MRGCSLFPLDRASLGPGRWVQGGGSSEQTFSQARAVEKPRHLESEIRVSTGLFDARWPDLDELDPRFAVGSHGIGSDGSVPETGQSSVFLLEYPGDSSGSEDLCDCGR